jgi:hypothetical protein
MRLTHKPKINKINRINKERERAAKDREPSVEPEDSRYPGGLREPGTRRPKRDQEIERTVSARGRAKGTAASENPRSAK